MSGIYDVTLAAGAVANIGVLGSYLKIRSAPYGLVQVKLDGGETYLLDEGLGVRLPDGKTFRDVQVMNRSTSTQTILLFIGDSRFEDTRVTGSVAIIDAIPGNAQSFGINFGTLSAFTTLQLIDPTTNLRGIIVHSVYGSALAGAGGTVDARLVASAAAPVSFAMPYAGAAILLAHRSTGSGDAQNASNFALQRRIPVGWGVWLVGSSNVAAPTACSFNASWSVL